MLMRLRLRRVAWIVVGGPALLLCAGCDEQVRQTILDATEAGAVRIVTGLVQALFQFWSDSFETDTTGATAAMLALPQMLFA